MATQTPEKSANAAFENLESGQLVGLLRAPSAPHRPAAESAASRHNKWSEPVGRQSALTWLFAFTIFTSAFLGFSLQPMVGRMILPKFGGAPAVWSTALLFFQATLVAGYTYAHIATTRLTVRRSMLLHIGLVVLPLAVLPIAIPQSWRPPAEGVQVLWLLGYLLASAGLPFFVISTGAPLLQKWFAAIGHSRSRDPYFLYAASNAGSLLGLLSYPIWIEPTFGVRGQSCIWCAGYVLLIGLICLCAIAVWRSRGDWPPAVESQETGDSKETFATRLRWLTLAFIPASLLLGVTAVITTDLAPVPLLWVIPLGLYLLTFIVAFGSAPAWIHRWLVWALPLLIVLPLSWGYFSNNSQFPLLAEIAMHLTVFTAVCLVLHTELARLRPAASRLTGFYLWISLGGMLGGAFNTLLAPMIFKSIAEYRLMLIAAGLAMPAWRPCLSWLASRRREVAATLLFAVFAGCSIWLGAEPLWRFGLPLLAGAALLTRRWSFSLGVGAVCLLAAVELDQPKGTRVYCQGRSFFGTFTVVGDEAGQYRMLVHGQTLHGSQYTEGEVRRVPLAYYDPTGPLGAIFAAVHQDQRPCRVAVIGLGTGSAAAYGRHGDQFTFFEIDPAVEQIARTQFTYLDDSKATCQVVLGDGRQSMMREADGKYRLIVLDAFNSDAIPTHLLTCEAIKLYCDKLADGGMIAVHLTNRYLDLGPVVFTVGKASGLLPRTWWDDQGTPAATARGKQASRWAVLVRREADLHKLKIDPRWERICRGEVAPWTDDHSNIFEILHLNGLSAAGIRPPVQRPMLPKPPAN